MGGQRWRTARTCKSIAGTQRIGDVVMVDQSPLARTPRSTPILYLGLFDQVRELFAAQPEAMAQGLTASSFSFNSGNGRCERCSGTGYEKIEMQFLSDLYVRCAECEGKRFQPHGVVCNFVVCADAHPSTERRFDRIVFYLLRDLSNRSRKFPRARC